ncbi:MAG: hypothetical protein ACI841_000764 [Planctomycetota bacterium]|jgi:hypothetical protein
MTERASKARLAGGQVTDSESHAMTAQARAVESTSRLEGGPASRAGTFMFRLWCAMMFVFALLAGCAHLGVLPLATFGPLGIPLVAFAAALPVIAWASPTESSPLKLSLFGAIVSLPLLAGVFGVARPALGPQQALAAAMFVAAALQLFGLRARVRFEALGRAAWMSLAFSSAVASFSAWRSGLFAGGMELSSEMSVRAVAAAQMLLRAGPIESPWFADTPFMGSLVHAHFGASSAGLCGLSLAALPACFDVHALLCIGVAAYLMAATLWGEGKRCVLTVLLMYCAWGALNPWLFESGATDRPLAFAAHAGPTMLAVAATFVAWVAGSHALRHAKRPWPMLLACAHLCAVLWHPAIGLAGAVVSLCALLVCAGAPGVRSRVGIVLAVAALPGLVSLRLQGTEQLAYLQSNAPTMDWNLRAASISTALLVAIAIAGGFRRFPIGPNALPVAGRQSVVGLLLCAALIPMLITGAGLTALVGEGQRLAFGLFTCETLWGLASLTSLGLSALAAGNLISMWEKGRVQRVLFIPLVAILLFASAWSARDEWTSVRSAPSLQGGQMLIAGDGLQLIVEPEVSKTESNPRVWRPGAGRSDGPDLAAALQWLRVEAPRDDNPLLLLGPAAPGWQLSEGGLPVIALLADMPLWAIYDEVGPQPALGQSPDSSETSGATVSMPAASDSPVNPWTQRRRARSDRIASLYDTKKNWDTAALLELGRLERTAYALVEEADRRRTHRGDNDHPYRGIDLRLQQLGGKRVFESGRVCIYSLGSPADSKLR